MIVLFLPGWDYMTPSLSFTGVELWKKKPGERFTRLQRFPPRLHVLVASRKSKTRSHFLPLPACLVGIPWAVCVLWKHMPVVNKVFPQVYSILVTVGRVRRAWKLTSKTCVATHISESFNLGARNVHIRTFTSTYHWKLSLKRRFQERCERSTRLKKTICPLCEAKTQFWAHNYWLYF